MHSCTAACVRVEGWRGRRGNGREAVCTKRAATSSPYLELAVQALGHRLAQTVGTGCGNTRLILRFGTHRVWHADGICDGGGRDQLVLAPGTHSVRDALAVTRGGGRDQFVLPGCAGGDGRTLAITGGRWRASLRSTRGPGIERGRPEARRVLGAGPWHRAGQCRSTTCVRRRPDTVWHCLACLVLAAEEACTHGAAYTVGARGRCPTLPLNGRPTLRERLTHTVACGCGIRNVCVCVCA